MQELTNSLVMLYRKVNFSPRMVTQKHNFQTAGRENLGFMQLDSQREGWPVLLLMLLELLKILAKYTKKILSKKSKKFQHTDVASQLFN